MTRPKNRGINYEELVEIFLCSDKCSCQFRELAEDDNFKFDLQEAMKFAIEKEGK